MSTLQRIDRKVFHSFYELKKLSLWLVEKVFTMCCFIVYSYMGS